MNQLDQTVMKLDLKHIAPYLPYELLGYATDINLTEKITVHNVIHCLYEQEKVKLLLIPLSELPKQAKATVVGIRNIDQINSKCCYLIYHKDGETYFDDLPEQMAIEDVWDTYEQLFAEHYDVFGLIEQGLALNKLEYGQSK